MRKLNNHAHANPNCSLIETPTRESPQMSIALSEAKLMTLSGISWNTLSGTQRITGALKYLELIAGPDYPTEKYRTGFDLYYEKLIVTFNQQVGPVSQTAKQRSRGILPQTAFGDSRRLKGHGISQLSNDVSNLRDEMYFQHLRHGH